VQTPAVFGQLSKDGAAQECLQGTYLANRDEVELAPRIVSL
jgi:hypothetical protein